MEKDQKKRTINAWIKSSQEDFAVVRDLFNHKRYTHCLYFCQLSLEKLFKAVYINTKNTYPIPTHDLVKLVRKAGLELDQEKVEKLAEITTFNVEARYDIFKDKLYKKATRKFAKKYMGITKNFQEELKKLLL